MMLAELVCLAASSTVACLISAGSAAGRAPANTCVPAVEAAAMLQPGPQRSRASALLWGADGTAVRISAFNRDGHACAVSITRLCDGSSGQAADGDCLEPDRGAVVRLPRAHRSSPAYRQFDVEYRLEDPAAPARPATGDTRLVITGERGTRATLPRVRDESF